MTGDTKPNLPLEIGRVLFIDIVGYSKLRINEQGAGHYSRPDVFDFHVRETTR